MPRASKPMPNLPPTAKEAMPEKRRAALLAREVEWMLSSRSNKLISRNKYQAKFVVSKKPYHIFHLLMTLLTFGFWSPIWLLSYWSSGDYMEIVRVDKYGQVIRTRSRMGESNF